jgi:signal transduction histidine kinase
MKDMTDRRLVAEIRRRLDTKNDALKELRTTLANLEEVNRKLRASEELKSRFLSNIRNEINNPLSSIMALADNLGNLVERPDEIRSVASMISSEASELEFQLNNIFVASELEAGACPVTATRVRIRETLRDVVDSVVRKNLCPPENIRFEAELAEDAVFRTDADKLVLILINLLSNAVKFGGPDGKIKITANIEEQRLVISVSNGGPGIKSEDHNLIFDRFRQLEEGMTKSYRGHGLGLSISKALLDLMGGEISVSSKSGDGATFTVSLPDSTNDETEGTSLVGNEEIFEDGEDEIF